MSSSFTDGVHAECCYNFGERSDLAHTIGSVGVARGVLGFVLFGGAEVSTGRTFEVVFNLAI